MSAGEIKNSKKRKKGQLDEDESKEREEIVTESVSDEEEEDESSDEGTEDEETEQLEAEFEAFSPLPCDREGIYALLQQLFKKEPIELGLLTDHLINENNMCTVIKQLDGEKVDEDDTDVFSISAFIHLNKNEDKPFIKLINKFLIRTAKEKGNERLVQLLEDPGQNKMLVLNERFINLPAKLGVMSLQNLLDETKSQRLEVNYFVFLCKLLKVKDESSVRKGNNKRGKSSADESGMIFLNSEEEIFANNAVEKYEFEITESNSDLTVNQNWKSGQQFVPFRKVLLLDQTALSNSLKQLAGVAN